MRINAITHKRTSADAHQPISPRGPDPKTPPETPPETPTEKKELTEPSSTATEIHPRLAKAEPHRVHLEEALDLASKAAEQACLFSPLGAYSVNYKEIKDEIDSITLEVRKLAS